MVVVQCFETVGWKGIWPLKTCTSYPRDCLSEQVKNEKQSVSWKMFFIKRYAGSNPINTSAVPPPHTHRCFTIIIWVNLCWPAPLPQRFNACMPVLTATVAFAVSQWPSGNMPDCGVRGPRFESHRRRLCLSRQPLRYTALGTGCTPLLQCLGLLSLPPSAGR